MSRFSETEQTQLADLARLVEWSKAHLARAERLRMDELPLDRYERAIVADYRKQMRAVTKAFADLLDTRLERSPDADQRERAVENGYQVLAALQAEPGWIVDPYFEAYGSTGATEE